MMQFLQRVLVVVALVHRGALDAVGDNLDVAQPRACSVDGNALPLLLRADGRLNARDFFARALSRDLSIPVLAVYHLLIIAARGCSCFCFGHGSRDMGSKKRLELKRFLKRGFETASFSSIYPAGAAAAYMPH